MSKPDLKCIFGVCASGHEGTCTYDPDERETDRYHRVLEATKPDENTSDGYHTFKELYQYRMLYNAAFFSMAHFTEDSGLTIGWNIHKSKRHHDGEECFGGGWFIVMATLPGQGQISNHYELKDWDKFDIPEREKADEWDGHTPEQAAERLIAWLKKG